MAITDKINIDFQALHTGDPKLLVIIDTSIWGVIENKPSIIEIILPGSQKTRVYNFAKSKSNVFNSSNLLITPIGTYKDLIDGIYQITVKGSPDSYCQKRSFLKTDKIRLLIGDLYLEDYFSCEDISNSKIKILRDIKMRLDAAEILAAKGDLKKASKELELIYKEVKKYIECRG